MVIPALPTLQRELHTTTTWVTWVLTVLLLVASVATPIFGKLGDQYGKERLLVISLALFFVGCGGVEHLDPDLLPRLPGSGGGGVPAELRDHPRRVPAREGRRRDRPYLGRVRRRRRLRDRLLGPDRRPPVLALALHLRRDPGRDRSRARAPVRARVADQD